MGGKKNAIWRTRAIEVLTEDGHTLNSEVTQKEKELLNKRPGS